MRENRAFSLLEVLMATAMIGFGILTMIGVYISGLKLMAQGRDLTAATDLARAELQSIQELGYEKLPGGTSSFDGRNPDPAVAPFPPAPYPSAQINNQQFQLLVSVTQQDTYLKSVVVTCFWGSTSNVTLQTLVAP